MKLHPGPGSLPLTQEMTQTHRDRPEMGGGNKGWRRVRVFTINDVELPTLLPPSPRMENWKTATDSLFL